MELNTQFFKKNSPNIGSNNYTILVLLNIHKIIWDSAYKPACESIFIKILFKSRIFFIMSIFGVFFLNLDILSTGLRGTSCCLAFNFEEILSYAVSNVSLQICVILKTPNSDVIPIIFIQDTCFYTKVRYFMHWGDHILCYNMLLTTGYE